MALFLGQYPAAPSSPATFALLLIRFEGIAVSGHDDSPDQVLSGALELDLECPAKSQRSSPRNSLTKLRLENLLGDRKGTTKKLCDKDLAERSGELSGAICLQTLVLLGIDPIAPSNRSENSFVLFVRFFGFVGPFWLLN